MRGALRKPLKPPSCLNNVAWAGRGAGGGWGGGRVVVFFSVWAGRVESVAFFLFGRAGEIACLLFCCLSGERAGLFAV